MIRSVIIDDERLARKELRSSLEAHKEIEVLDEAANAEEAIAKIEEHKPDLIFLDIQMPGKDGFELLSELESVPQVVFVTAYDEYAIKAFEVNALDYIMKPIEEERLAEAINKVRESMEVVQNEEERMDRLTEDDQVFVKDGDKCWFVQLKDVSLFESEGNYVRVYFENNKPLILKSLNNLDKRLDDRTFFRANRKHIINLKWVDRIEAWFNGGLLAEMKGGNKRIEVSRRQAAKLKEKMSL